MRIDGDTLIEGECHKSNQSTNGLWCLGRIEVPRNILLSFEIDCFLSDDASVTK